jgi:hypothetical protein
VVEEVAARSVSAQALAAVAQRRPARRLAPATARLTSSKTAAVAQRLVVRPPDRQTLRVVAQVLSAAMPVTLVVRQSIAAVRNSQPAAVRSTSTPPPELQPRSGQATIS